MDLQKLIALGSAAYGLGFVTVLLHTARLGIPVLDLADPTVVWVGAPVAILGMLSAPLWRWFVARRAKALNEFTALKDDFRNLATSNQTAAIDAFVDAIEKSVPSLVGFQWLVRRWLKWSANLIRRNLEKKGDPHSNEPKLSRWVTMPLQALAIIFRAQYTLNLILQPIIVALYVLGVIAIYVWFIYPVIPQRLGGGRSENVRLVVDSAKLPHQLATRWRDVSFDSTSDTFKTEGKPVSPLTTVPLHLLYQSRDAFFIKDSMGTVTALARGAVNAVVWNPGQRLP